MSGVCRLSKATKVTILDRVLIKSVERPVSAFDTVSIDCCGPIEPPSGRGHHFILVMVDHCSRWPECVPLKTLNAQETCTALNTIFQRIGIPRVVISDNGSNFVSNLNQIFFQKFGIEARNSTPMHPQGNSLAERLVQNLKKMLHHVIVSDKPRDWDLKLPNLLWALRSLENETTGVTPYEMVYGKQGRGPLEIIRDTWTGKVQEYVGINKSAKDYLLKLKEDLKTCNEVATENSSVAQRKYVEQYNVRAREKSFSVGDQVLVLLPDSTNKIQSSWQGPANIHYKMAENSYTVEMPNGAIRHLHANHLRPYKVGVNGVGIVFDSDEEKYGSIEGCETGIIGDCMIETELTQEKIDALDLNHLPVKHQYQLKQLLFKYKSVFNDKPGCCKSAFHSIKLEEGFVPKRYRPYRIPDKLKPEVDRQIDELLKEGKIIPSNSAFAHPIVLVYKPDKSIRICVDFRHLNEGTINDRYPMARADEVIRKIAPASIITTLDCTSGYYQIPMDPKCVHMTSFITHRNSYSFLYMPFGAKCAGQTFQRVIDNLLKDHQDYALGFIDDISVYSSTWEDHLIHLENVLAEFKSSGMTLKFNKCCFAKKTVKFLGHIIGSGTVQVIQEKITAIVNMPEPNTKKLLRGFLGMCNYYRSFIPNFSEMAAPLTELTKGGKRGSISFNSEQREAFIKLKDKLCLTVKLAVPDYTRPFLIQCDASDIAVGCCLSQKTNDGQEQPLAFASVKLTETQTRWSTIEKEAYAVVYALQQFEHIVFGSKIHLFTDHNPLQYIINNNNTCNKLTRWALHLSRYDLTVHPKRGQFNSNADCLSRLV